MKKRISISDQEFEEIEQYLNGSIEDLPTYEKKMKQDPEWPEKVRMVALTIAGIREAGLENELKQIKLTAGKAPVRSMRKRSTRFSLLALAAAIILVVVSLVWVGVFKSRGDKLYSAFYHPDTGLLTSMGAADEYKFDVAMIDYKTGNYTDAIEKWSALQPQHGDNDTLNYFIGSAYMALGQLEDAESFFSHVLQNKESMFYHDAQWYYGLALIKQGQLQKAIPYIRASNHDSRDKLLKKLEK